ncbi:MAG: 4Fe-4S dicluster domain-containing protein, partial [bacterium]
HPGTGETLQVDPAPRIDYVQLCRALGVKHIFTTDAYDLEKVISTIKKATSLNEPAVIITNRPCTLYPVKRKYETFIVLTDQCNGCGACLRIGCPAIMMIDETTEKGLHKVKIDPDSCTGCSLCQQVCPVDAIVTESGEPPAVFRLEEIELFNSQE